MSNLKLFIISRGSISTFSSNFGKHVYSVSKFIERCKIVNEKKINSSRNMNNFGGPLKSYPNNLNGQKRLQNLRETLDKNLNIKDQKQWDRSAWKNRALPPRKALTANAPITPGTNLTKAANRKAGIAMVTGVVLEKGRDIVLTKIIQSGVRRFIPKISKKHPSARQAIISISIKLLKTNTDYGRAPFIKSIQLEKLVNNNEIHSNLSFVEKMAHKMCITSISEKKLSLELTSKDIDSYGYYENGALFLYVKW